MPENRFAKYGPAPQQSGNRFAKYGPPPGQDEIVGQYANEIVRRNEIYRTIPQEQLADPDRLYALAQLEAQRNGYKPVKPIEKQDRVSSAVMGYTQGGTFGFADEVSGAVDFVGGAGMGLARGEGLGAIESGKKAYSDRVEKDRRVLRQARVDNPVSTLGGELAGGIITYAPAPAGWMGAGARTTSQVAAQAAAKAAKLRTLSQTGVGVLQANRASRAANLGAKAAQLSRPAATLSEGAARFGGRVAESVGKGIGYGAAYGGVYGLGAAEGNLGERMDDAAKGAAYGAVGGAILSPAMQFVVAPIVGKAGYAMFTPLENKALDKVLQRAQRSGTSLTDVRAAFDKWAKTGEVPETLAELMGSNERSLLSAMISVNRETRERAAEVFVGRGREEVNRLEDAFARSFGAGRGDYAKAQSAAIKARVEDPEPFYTAAHFDQTGALKPLDPQKQASLNNVLADEDDIARIVRDAAADLNRMGHKAARDEVRLYGEALQAARRGERVPIPRLSVQAADYIERAINQSYKAAGGGSGEISGSISGWRTLRNNVRAIIDDTGIGEARATAAERIRRGELLDEGLDIMKPSVDVDDVNRIMKGIPDAGIPAASDEGRTAYGIGAARAIANDLRQVADMGGFADATRKVARTPALREKLEAARPKTLTVKGKEDQRTTQTRNNAALDEAIERASNRAQFGVDMVGNSKTAFRQGDIQDAVLDDSMATQIGDSVSDLLMSGVGGASQKLRDKLARFAGNRIGQPSIYRPGMNRAMADILLATDKEIPVQIARLAARAAQRASGKARIRPMVPPQTGGTPPRTPPAGPAAGAASAAPVPPRGTPPGGAAMPAAPVRGAGFIGFQAPAGSGKRPSGFLDDLERGTDRFYDPRLGAEGSNANKAVEMAKNGYSNSEIAEALGQAEGAVRTALSRARALGIDIPKAMNPGGAAATETGSMADVLRLKSKGYTNAQIREATGKSPETIKVMLSKERKRLRDAGEEIPGWLSPEVARSNGLGALKADLGSGVAGAGVGALGPADSNEDRMRNILIGAGVGLAANRIPVRSLEAFEAGARRTVGKTRTAGFQTAMNKNAKSSAVWFDDAGDEIAEFPEMPGLALIIGRDGHVNFTLGGQIAKSEAEKAGSVSDIVSAINLVVPAIRQHAKSPSARSVYSFDGATPEHVNVYRRLLARGIGGDMNVYEATRGGRFYVSKASQDEIEKAFGTVRKVTEQDARPLVLSKKDRVNRLSPWNVSPPERPILTAGFGGGRPLIGRPRGNMPKAKPPNHPKKLLNTRMGSSWREPEAAASASAVAVRAARKIARTRPNLSIGQAVAAPGRMVASGMRAVDRRLRAPEDPRLLQPAIASGQMKLPPSGNVPQTRPAIERMENPRASADVLAGIQRRSERAYGAEKGEGVIPGRTERALDTLKKIEGYMNSVATRLDDLRARSPTDEGLALAIEARKVAAARYMKGMEDLSRLIVGGAPAEQIARVQQDVVALRDAMKAVIDKPKRAPGLPQLERIDAELTRAMQDASAATGIFGPSGRQIRSDNEVADLLTNPARAPDAAKVAKAKPLGSHEIKGQLAVWGGIGAAGAGMYAAGEKEKRERSEDYYAKRDAYDYENKDVPGITGERLAEIQRFLNYVVPGETPLTEDGKMGPATKAAIKRYQEMRGLKANGRRTWQTIEDIEREMSAPEERGARTARAQ